MKSIETRLEWYKTDVVPVVEYYRTNSYYNFVEINGEQSVEAVHAEILKAIK
jgi:adenylate kinase family enzyme